MNDDLEILLEIYNEEKLQIEKLIERYIGENDYELAYYNSRPLNIADRKLEVLNRLKDPYYDKKEWLKREKEFYIKRCLKETNDFKNEIWQEKLNEVERKEELINQRAIEPTVPGQELDDAFFDVAEGIIESFKFYLRKGENLFIECKLITAGTLQISLSSASKEVENNFFFEEQKKSLIGLGFRYDEQKGCFVYMYEFHRFKSAGFLKRLLARIVFDVFSFNVDNPGTIVYRTEKSS